MMMENTFGNNVHDLRKHYQLLKEKGYISKQLGLRRFEQLRAAISPSLVDLDNLFQLLRKSIQRYFLLLLLLLFNIDIV